MTQTRSGFFALIGAYTIWGLSALYYREVTHVPALEVLAHRTVWSFIAFFGIIAAQGRIREMFALLHPRTRGQGLSRIAPAAFVISINWFLFVYAIQSDSTLEASLAYYIYPLMAAGVGWVLFSERLHGLQYLSMGLGIVAVTVLTVGLGAVPWLALMMSATFMTYGTIKKGLAAGPVIAMAAETTLIAPFALIYLIGAELWGWGGSAAQPAGAFGADLWSSFVLMLAGVVTGVPLLLFSMAARRLSLTVVGLGNYYNATLQLIVAVTIFDQVITPSHSIALPLIWVALAAFTFESFRRERQDRKARTAATSSSTLPTEV
ncbi:EamA family transporter RarD [Celeribacter sp.]|uniref:EamA family transporter RarD n=1 Tax=Celeribacter sp. TaxID=1890673 RepID=UPI003A93D605